MADGTFIAPKFTTFGCRLNAYETEAMKDLATQAGVSNAVIVNTCAVTAEAVRKAKQEIRKLRRDNPTATLIVTGCAAKPSRRPSPPCPKSPTSSATPRK
jgi:threonylcarbamoyladenosine tRNA methylthiotransferase MtaB